MTRPAKVYVHAGESLTLAGWAARAGFHPNTLRRRLGKMSFAEAVALPPGAPSEARRSARRPCPAMRYHRGTGQAYVAFRVRGRRRWHWLGPWGSRKAVAMYRRFAREWPRQLAAGAAEVEHHLRVVDDTQDHPATG